MKCHTAFAAAIALAIALALALTGRAGAAHPVRATPAVYGAHLDNAPS